ncbi:hypothetical protein CWR48_00945 [Oceanobacillus arenosus]|uniref:Uncharacterized protein n=1 Tax=Oceanobacillus arenosus TaxID=1229153 RepID=A0A3D8Q1J5_9BACI|nr:hypothetical protein CWR48_00945 [Oceanobacillus arenosus]
MRHPYEKFARIELISLVIVILFGLIALIQGFLILIFFSLYLIALSLVCDALLHLYFRNSQQAGKQILRAVMLFIFATYLLFAL